MTSSMVKSKKEIIMGSVAKFLPDSMTLNDSSNKMHISNSQVFHTSVNLYSNSSLRSRKHSASGQWLPPAKLVEPRRPPSPGMNAVCVQLDDMGTDYTQSTTLHGLRYVGDSHLHFVERFFWMVAFILGILGAAYFITSLYTRWKESPMIVSLAPTPTLLEAIPFPAITICNMNGARKTVAEPIMNNDNNDRMTLLEKKIVNDMCDGPKENSPKARGNWSVVQKIMIKVSQPCHDMLVACKWRSIKLNCTDLFNPELTDEGMCCSFNKVWRNYIYRNPKDVSGLMNYTFPYHGIDWTPEKGYPVGTPVETIPWRAWGPGRSNGLTIVLDAQIYEYFCSSTASMGFKTMLHNPVEAPKMADMAYFVTPGVETRVEIIPKISKSTENLQNIPLAKRLCLFQSEKVLRFYRTYTQRNCQLECQSNYTLNQCDCVPFYLPKDAENRVCGTSDEDCVADSKAAMEEEQLLKLVNVSAEEPNTLQCSCLPSCDNIEYTKQMSASKLENIFAVKSDYLGDRDPAYYKENMAVVHFFFIENTFIAVEKGEIFGLTEFISNTGGLLGLFLGFSIMSAAEIFYFASLRLICTWWRGRNQIHHSQHTHQPNYPIPFTR